MNLKFSKLIAWSLLVFFFASCGKGEQAEEVALGKVTKGTLYLELYEEGEIEAVNSTTISAPRLSWRFGNLKITTLVRDGTEVKEGDTLVVFDPSEVNKGVLDAESRLDLNLADLERMEAQHLSDLEDLEADYELASISHEISKIRFESADFEADIRKKEIQLNLERAAISLEKAKEQIENRKKIQNEEKKQKRLSIEQDRIRLKESFETLEKLRLISPSPGIAIIAQNWSSGKKYQSGDQCWSGSPLIQLPDLSKLKATVKINEVDIAKIEKNLRVEIRPDAFSDSIYTGTVHSVANLAINKDENSKIKVFPVEIYIKETSAQLLPGLTVNCRIILGEIDDVLMVPIDAVRSKEGEVFVYKKSGKGFEKVLVETGESNKDFIIITKGLKENDRIALSDPFVDDEKETEKEA